MMSQLRDTERKHRVAVIGGGLVGSLNAIFFARNGYSVAVYESRSDMRQEEQIAGRSINLALSERGRKALRTVGLEDEVVNKFGIPMHGRMLHSHSGQTTIVPYGKPNEFLLSVDRRKLNELLLSKAEQEDDIVLEFKHKLLKVDLTDCQMVFSSPDGEIHDMADLVVGCDGAYSTVRKSFMRSIRFNFSQTYILHGYKELLMPAGDDGNYAMEKNYLHIWPRQTFMMIALPNLDSTFTCTMFMPYDIFGTIKTQDDVLAFFEREFPDAISLFGRDRLLETYMVNPVGPLISIKCSPYHVEGRAVIMGDAAHAMVPFYGQGMNAGFEDCTILHELIHKHGGNLDAALAEYTETRNKDTAAICDLAMYNYVEMRSLVASRWFRIKKKIDNFLNWLMPQTFTPLYTMVTFTSIPYEMAYRRWQWQDKMIYRGLWCAAVTALVVPIAVIAYNWTEDHPWKARALKYFVTKSLHR
ncbi:kynurenine 3-monooxygenase-like [Corticium candelabrum]|uniref:kynurenine 3-monooxygenase-like n=1 Tax=Corticium candelabrum TaxID=121492 RepID=UPI002E276DD3|nr:kynurenine 3-monooxygenase-like [Corticium candelabrum]